MSLQSRPPPRVRFTESLAGARGVGEGEEPLEGLCDCVLVEVGEGMREGKISDARGVGEAAEEEGEASAGCVFWVGVAEKVLVGRPEVSCDALRDCVEVGEALRRGLGVLEDPPFNGEAVGQGNGDCVKRVVGVLKKLKRAVKEGCAVARGVVDARAVSLAAALVCVEEGAAEALVAFTGVTVAKTLALRPDESLSAEEALEVGETEPDAALIFEGVGAFVALLARARLSAAEALLAGDAEAAPEELPGAGEVLIIGDVVCRGVGVCGCTVVTSISRTKGNFIL
jgi:hypothetical protein